MTKPEALRVIKDAASQGDFSTAVRVYLRHRDISWRDYCNVLKDAQIQHRLRWAKLMAKVLDLDQTERKRKWNQQLYRWISWF